MWGGQYENLKQIFWVFSLSYVLCIESFQFFPLFFYEEETAAMTGKKYICIDLCLPHCILFAFPKGFIQRISKSIEDMAESI